MPSSVRCFKSFFKHTWHPEQVDLPTRFLPAKTETTDAVETELSEVKLVIPTASVATSTPIQVGGVSCSSADCKSFRTSDGPRSESPWHLLKTIFLVSMIVALILWVIVYTLLTQYQIL